MDIGLILIGVGAFIVLILFLAVISMATEGIETSSSSSDLGRIRVLQEYEYMRNSNNYGKDTNKT